MNKYSYRYDEVSDSVPEKDKLGETYLMGNINRYISELIEEKHDLKLAYDYWNGRFAKGEFRYLEDMYGV